MKPISRYKQVFVRLTAGTVAGATVPFPLVEELRDKRVTAIEFYNITMLAATQDQQPVITAADAVGCEVVFKEHSTERVQSIPLATLLPTNIGGIYKQFVPFVINWQSSLLRVNVTPATLPCTVPFGMCYED